MILSEDKITHLSHLILNDLKKSPVTLREDEISVLREIKRSIIAELRLDDDVDAIVKKKLSSYTKKVAEGSPEWTLQYNRFFEEEMRKRRR
ncbi:MAG: DUF507 family protein [Nitrospirae bacterium]|nr:DUF507 family protein [Nitrospirota bacterium]